MPVRRILNFLFDLDQILVGFRQIDLCFLHSGADVARDVQVVSLLGDSLHRDALGIPVLFLAKLVGLNNLCDVLVPQAVLAFALLKVLGGIDEKHVVRLLAFFKHQNANGSPKTPKPQNPKTPFLNILSPIKNILIKENKYIKVD